MPDKQVSIGTELASRYLLERSLGEGGMGRVYAAVDSQLHRNVAIKLIREELDDPAARDRFLREAQSAAALSHPNACRLFEVSEHEGTPFLVMELMDGVSLSSRLEEGPMNREEALAVVLPLMDALAAFHAAGLIHRDIKPSNVFLTSQGVKLLDFGLARRPQRHDAITAPALSMPGAVTGTLRYMAPEQLTGDPLDARTDVFSLGVLLYEVLTGRIPFGDGTNVEWLNAVMTEDPPSLGEGGLRDLDPVISRALQRRPDDRFTTVEEFAAALRAPAENSRPVDAAPASASASTSATTSTPESGASGLRAVVLPFRLLQPDAEIAVLQNGIPEVLTGLLATDLHWDFLSNRVAQSFVEETDLVSVGRSLKVERLLTGSILRGGDELQVTVQLIDAADGNVQWSQTSRHTIGSVLQLQDEICGEIVKGVQGSEELAAARDVAGVS